MDKKPDYDSLYNVAEAQGGYFTTGQAKEAGYTYERLSDLTDRGSLIRIRRGIYRLPHFPASRFEDLHVASLRTGPHSVISHESALSVYALSDVLPGEVHVIMPRTGSRRRTGIQLHTHQLREDEVTRREGLPITTPARTIADVIAGGLAQEITAQATREALSRGLTSRTKLQQQAARRGGRVAEQLQKFIGEED